MFAPAAISRSDQPTARGSLERTMLPSVVRSKLAYNLREMVRKKFPIRPSSIVFSIMNWRAV